MPRKREKKVLKRYTLYKCKKCGQWKREREFPKRKNNGKIRIHSYCKECERKRENKRGNEETRKKHKKKYKYSLKGLTRQVIDDMLYKGTSEEAKKFRQTKNILIKLGEWNTKKAKEYKKDFLINILGLDNKIWSWLYENKECPEKEVIQFLLKFKKKWVRKDIKAKLEERLKQLNN